MFWIKVDVREKGYVEVTTYPAYPSGGPKEEIPLRTRNGTTVSQALRKLATAMATAKAETIVDNSSDLRKGEQK